jgi:hypothetical protein
MAWLEAIEHISHHTRFYWTGARLSDLNGLVAEGKSPDEVVCFFHTTVEEVQNGRNSLHALVIRHEVDKQLTGIRHQNLMTSGPRDRSAGGGRTVQEAVGCPS